MIQSFRAYLLLERGMAKNTIAAYAHDVSLLFSFLEEKKDGKKLEDIRLGDLQDFLEHINELEMGSYSQARIISGVKSFFRFLLLEDVIKEDPTELLQAPRLRKALPEALTLEEVDAIIAAIPLDKPEGHRNRAMLEVLYSCGLRVSELTSLLVSNLYLDLGYLRVIGKGDKERLVPIGEEAAKQINFYRQHQRAQLKIKEKAKDVLFLNRLGGPISRVMVFNIIKEAAAKANIKKNVYPHIFRHSFATHLVANGADLRAVQQMLGHSSITTTEIYLHMDTGYLRQTLADFHPRF